MRQYETMLVLPPEAEESTIQGVIDRISKVLAEKGEVGEVNRWGRRRLAYQIAHQSEGYYVLVDFKAEPAVIAELERVLHLADEVMRFKVISKAA